jgi:twitching motility protein PilI
VPPATDMTTHPLSILRTIEDRCRFASTSVPQRTTSRNLWSGVAFRVGTTTLVAAMGDVVEVLTYPDLSVVPYTCAWVRGIANIRGRLLTVVDLGGYLLGRLTPVSKRTRVMVAECRGVYSGLVVDEVMGLRHFPQEVFVTELSGIAPALRPHVHQGFRADGDQWGIFRLSSLVESPQFLHTAA